MTRHPKPKYRMVSTYAALKEVVRQCKKAGATALDFETTSLRPADGVVRLVSLCNKKVHALVDFAAIRGGFKKCAPLFQKGEWVVFNAGFERRWFIAAGVTNIGILDVGYLRRAIIGGGTFRLLDMVKWDLGEELDKEQQVSDWSKRKLSQEQLDYAYLDADVTWRLWLHWSEKADDRHWDGFRMLNDMVPAVIEMEEAGILLDTKVHKKLVDSWVAQQQDLIKVIRGLVGEDEVANINSDSQWSDYFARLLPDTFLVGWPRTEKTGQLSMTGKHLKKLAGLVPGTPLETFFDALSDYKTITKYISSFGEGLIHTAKTSEGGRLHARYNIGAAKTCRFSSSAPNLQQTPRDKDLLGIATSVRSSFIAPPGKKLVSLDYSGIELRVLALLANDQQLLEDMVTGDVHAEVASVVAGHKIDKTTPKGKAARQAAKGISFGIIYGSGASGLSATMRTTLDRAQGYIDFWANRYPDAFAYRYAMMEEAELESRIRCIDGGTIWMGKRPDLPKCANYPVQRGALAVMAKAIARHKKYLDFSRYAGLHTGTRMLSTIHDALIDEALDKDAAQCLEIMEVSMIEGYLSVFPGAPTDRLTEGGIGQSWGDLK